MDFNQESIELHRKHGGKIEVCSKIPLNSNDDLSIAYTPGVAAPCREIAADKTKAFELTIKKDTIAVISDGTAVLGLGNIGPHAALPVMEGKAMLFKELAGLNAFPICLDTSKVDIIDQIRALEPVFAGINLEDIAAPKCFEIEAALQDLGIPVIHDDQHATAIVVAAAFINAVKVGKKDLTKTKIVVNGAGSSALATAKLIMKMNPDVMDLIICDSKGTIYDGREGLNPYKQDIAVKTNKDKISGTLSDAVKGADVFIGLSVGGALTKEMVASMNEDPIIFAMANPTPEIMPQDAKAVGARLIGTGRSDFPNQINNVLAFPGVFKGALDAKAVRFNDEMKIAAAKALAAVVTDPTSGCFIASPFDKSVVPAVSSAVKEAAIRTGVVRK